MSEPRKDVLEWLIAWMEKKDPDLSGSLEEKLKINYLQAKIINSMNVLEMVIEIEETFGISFTPEHFQERRFATIGGLGEIISELS